jgi:ABC-three component (ABC-3C) system Middle Component 6
MILPTKHIPQERALLTVGSHILKQLDKQKTVSALWEETIAKYNNGKNSNPGISYDWFVLALDLLFTIEAIDIKDGLLRRRDS